MSDRSPVWTDILHLVRVVDASLYALDRDKLEQRLTAKELQGIQTTLTRLAHRLDTLQREAVERGTS